MKSKKRKSNCCDMWPIRMHKWY